VYAKLANQDEFEDAVKRSQSSVALGALSPTSPGVLSWIFSGYVCGIDFPAHKREDPTQPLHSRMFGNNVPPSTLHTTMLTLRRGLAASRAFRRFSTKPTLPSPANLSEGENLIYKKLTDKFSPTELDVQDISGTYDCFSLMRNLTWHICFRRLR
jgi:hypothetical protein